MTISTRITANNQATQPTQTPLYGVLRNGKPIYLDGMTTAYPQSVAHNIMQYLQAVSDDDYSLQVVQWIDHQATANYDNAMCEIARNGEVIKPISNIDSYCNQRLAHEIKMHLEAVTDDDYNIICHKAVSKQTLIPVSHFDTWED